jgi:homoaconitase/3-isopropylmalate dehydratase large subunit
MKFERIGRVTMCDLSIEIGGQINDVDSGKGTLLYANTTTNTELFRDEGNLGGRLNFDTELTYYIY